MSHVRFMSLDDIQEHSDSDNLSDGSENEEIDSDTSTVPQDSPSHLRTIKWSVLAKIINLLSVALVSVWFGKYHGVKYSTDIITYHPLFMTIAFLVFLGDALMIFTVFAKADRKVVLVVHILLLVTSLALAMVGLHSAIVNSKYTFASAHSWIGIGTCFLLLLQWLFSAGVYLLSNKFTKYMTHHWFFGVVIFCCASVACITGAQEFALDRVGSKNSSDEETMLSNGLVLSIVVGALVTVYAVTKSKFNSPSNAKCNSYTTNSIIRYPQP